MLVLPLYCNYSVSSEVSETPDALQEMKILENSSSRTFELLRTPAAGLNSIFEKEDTQLTHHTDMTSYISSCAYYKRA